jgi:hypothetical protein
VHSNYRIVMTQKRIQVLTRIVLYSAADLESHVRKIFNIFDGAQQQGGPIVRLLE